MYTEFPSRGCQGNLRVGCTILKHRGGELPTFLPLAFILRTQQSLSSTRVDHQLQVCWFPQSHMNAYHVVLETKVSINTIVPYLDCESSYEHFFGF